MRAEFRPARAEAIIEDALKVIASQVRKGNVVEVDGQLYAVLSAENFHPGKGTPTTQIDMRRISDGVKTSQRYKTTEQVERAFVEDHDYQYLYQDGDGYTFMNRETYEQVHCAGGHRRRLRALSPGEHDGQAAACTRACRSPSSCRSA